MASASRSAERSKSSACSGSSEPRFCATCTLRKISIFFALTALTPLPSFASVGWRGRRCAPPPHSFSSSCDRLSCHSEERGRDLHSHRLGVGLRCRRSIPLRTGHPGQHLPSLPCRGE